MKKKSASKSAFFNLRVLLGLCIALAGISLALIGLDAFTVNSAPVKIRNHIITASNDPLVPVGFDCSKIEELGIQKQENMRAGAIMIACAADSTPGYASVSAFFQRVGQGFKRLIAPFTIITVRAGIRLFMARPGGAAAMLACRPDSRGTTGASR